MVESAQDMRSEVERMKRVSDLLCTAHSALQIKYQRRSFVIDIAILLLSVWLTAMAFAEPQISELLAPMKIRPELWIGLLAIFTFGLSLIELKSEWKKLAEAHARSFTMYGEVKREAGYLLVSVEEIPSREFQRLTARYDMASDVGINVSDNNFLKLKQRHKVKIEISKILDKKPASRIALVKLKLFCRDSCPWK